MDSDTTHGKTLYNCETVNVSTPDLNNTVQNTEQATSITQNTEHQSEKNKYIKLSEEHKCQKTTKGY